MLSTSPSWGCSSPNGHSWLINGVILTTEPNWDDPKTSNFHPFSSTLPAVFDLGRDYTPIANHESPYWVLLLMKEILHHLGSQIELIIFPHISGLKPITVAEYHLFRVWGDGLIEPQKNTDFSQQFYLLNHVSFHQKAKPKVKIPSKRNRGLVSNELPHITSKREPVHPKGVIFFVALFPSFFSLIQTIKIQV